jgi:hypothetical protein
MKKNIVYLSFFFLLSCTNTSPKSPETSESEGVFSKAKMIHYAGLLNRDEYPVDEKQNNDLIRLHYDELYGVDYTYCIVKEPNSAGLMADFSLYSKAYDQDQLFMNKITRNDAAMNNKWNSLIAVIDSLGIFKKKDHRLLKGFGSLNLYVLEMKTGGTYKEIYIETYPQEQDQELLYLHDLMKSICPQTCKLDITDDGHGN